MVWNMSLDKTEFDARELCSRKLWQLVNGPSDEEVSELELKEAIQELAARRHYLAELTRLGKLETSL